MATGRKKTPDFFEDNGFDPVESATGYKRRSVADKNKPSSGSDVKNSRSIGLVAKKKAGFYLSVDVLERFTLKFHELKLAGVAIENKSTLLEAALSFALDDLDRGKQSQVLQEFKD